MIMDAESILKVCGIGSYLHIGCGDGQLVLDLLKRSVDAYGMDDAVENIRHNLDYAPGHFVQGSLINYPLSSSSFDNIIIGNDLLDFKIEELPAVFAALHSIAKRHLIIYFSGEALATLHSRQLESNRLFWEKMAIEAGLRLHPRSMLHTPYHECENEKVRSLLFFESIPTDALADYPLSWLLANRDHHMDMLREVGRRSDGHIARYVLAASKIRPGDVVLDAACGLGYGTAVMASMSPGAQFIGVDLDESCVQYAKANFAVLNPSLTFKACDVTKLAFLPDHSVDTIVSFETIEHLPDYDVFLAEAKRVLKPDGRFIGSVPNMWCDETGKDPNPHHYHVFDWNKLQNALAKYFIVEDRWAQTAGGGFKLRQGRREMHHIPVTINEVPETEWWLISACADPRQGKNVAYTNPFYKHYASLPPFIDFAKHYDNPWLYRTMVQLGERIANKDILTLFSVGIINEAKTGSADHGAALCVLCYQILESGKINSQDLATLIAAINKYDQEFDRNNPHAWRWAISLHYVGGRILLMHGNRADALNTFLTCAEMDPMRFSPLLATKTISAHMYAGLILAGNSELEQARHQFSQGSKEAHRALHANWENALGNPDNPLLFGLQEIAEVADLGSQCVQAITAIDQQGYVPGYFWDRINLRRFGIVEWTKSVELENKSLRQTLSGTQPMKTPAHA